MGYIAMMTKPQLDELEQLRAKMRCIVSHATGGATDDIELPLNEICVRITKKVNVVFKAGKESGRASVLKSLATPSDYVVQAACDATFGRDVLTPAEYHIKGWTTMLAKFSSIAYVKNFLDEWNISRKDCDFIIGELTAHGRFYHTIEHIEMMIRKLEEAFDADIITQYEFINLVMAAIFHDIVYDPTQSDNEARSATLAVEMLSRQGEFDVPFIERAILATSSHELPDAETREELLINLFVKIDLSILWSPDASVYEWYARGIRQEYKHYPYADYKVGRTKVLQKLSVISEHLTEDEAACLDTNITWELDALETGALND
jgi:predicted metal-dependent HD superfamily phosphohydrolase